MRDGFTMLELVIVIVIIGILAVVALPRFMGTKGQAHNAIVREFVGVLNRSVGPTLWSKSMLKSSHGSIQRSEFCGILDEMIQIPNEISFIQDQNDCNTTNLDVSFFGGAIGHIVLVNDGNQTASPKWVYNP